MGELQPITRDFLKAGGGKIIDAVTWHWYALESKRCPLHGWLDLQALRGRAVQKLWMLLKGGRIPCSIFETSLPLQQVWLGETSLVSCGGAKNITNTFTGTSWWLDELCRQGQLGADAVFRQVLVGGDYALIDGETLEPRPDFWASLLFATLLQHHGNVYLGQLSIASNLTDPSLLRTYMYTNESHESSFVVLISLSTSPSP